MSRGRFWFGSIRREVVGDVYVTMRDPNHFFRRWGGFGISVSVVDALRAVGVMYVRVVYRRMDGGRSSYLWRREVAEGAVRWSDGDDMQVVLRLVDAEKDVQATLMVAL